MLIGTRSGRADRSIECSPSTVKIFLTRCADQHNGVLIKTDSALISIAYLGHSLRSGGSSAAEAIGVPRFRGNWLGGWSQHSTTREVHYLDPSILPTPAAHALFGWLLAGAYTCDHPHWERSPHTRERTDAGEAA